MRILMDIFLTVLTFIFFIGIIFEKNYFSVFKNKSVEKGKVVIACYLFLLPNSVPFGSVFIINKKNSAQYLKNSPVF